MNQLVATYEEKGRILAKQILNKSTQYKWVSDSVDAYAIYDQVWKNLQGQNILVEIKVRSCKIDKYKSALLEASKYNALRNIADNHNCLIYYVNFYNDGVKIYHINDLFGYAKKSIKAPAKTFVNKKDKIDKQVYELNNDKLIHKLIL